MRLEHSPSCNVNYARQAQDLTADKLSPSNYQITVQEAESARVLRIHGAKVKDTKHLEISSTIYVMFFFQVFFPACCFREHLRPR